MKANRKKHGTDGKRRVWRKLHLAFDTDTHEIIASELTLTGVTDAEVLPNQLKQTRRSLRESSEMAHAILGSATGRLRLGKQSPYAAFWEKGHPRNLAVGCQNYMARTKGGNRSMVVISVQYLRPLCIA